MHMQGSSWCATVAALVAVMTQHRRTNLRPFKWIDCWCAGFAALPKNEEHPENGKEERDSYSLPIHRTVLDFPYIVQRPQPEKYRDYPPKRVEPPWFTCFGPFPTFLSLLILSLIARDSGYPSPKLLVDFEEYRTAPDWHRWLGGFGCRHFKGSSFPGRQRRRPQSGKDSTPHDSEFAQIPDALLKGVRHLAPLNHEPIELSLYTCRLWARCGALGGNLCH